MTNKDFEMIVKNTIPEDIFCNLKKVKYSICPDEYVGKVSDKEWIRTDITSPDFISANLTENVVVLVLESPHKDEYKTALPHPAQGKTGTAIKKYLYQLFYCFCEEIKEEFAEYDLILMNAVPFQCSLGENPDLYRDKIFEQTWHGGGKKFFEDRFDSLLKKLHDKNVIVINACTQGYKNSRKDMVTGCIKEKDLQVYEIDHPASWRIPQIMLK